MKIRNIEIKSLGLISEFIILINEELQFFEKVENVRRCGGGFLLDELKRTNHRMRTALASHLKNVMCPWNEPLSKGPIMEAR